MNSSTEHPFKVNIEVYCKEFMVIARILIRKRTRPRTFSDMGIGLPHLKIIPKTQIIRFYRLKLPFRSLVFGTTLFCVNSVYIYK